MAPKAQVQKKLKAEEPKKAPVVESSEDSDDSSEEETTKKVVVPANKKAQKVEAKAAVKKAVVYKKESSSEEDSSEEEVKPTSKKAVPVKAPIVPAKKVAKKESSSDEDSSEEEQKPAPKKVVSAPAPSAKKAQKVPTSSEESSEEEKPAPKKTAAIPAKAAQAAKKAPVKKESSDDSDSSEEEKPAPKKPVTAAKVVAASKAPAVSTKKAPVQQKESSEDEDSSSEEEKPVSKKAVPASKAVAATKAPAVSKKAPAKQESSEDEDSSEEEKPAPKKGAAVVAKTVAPAKKVAKKESSSSDEDEEEEEEQKPAAKKVEKMEIEKPAPAQQAPVENKQNSTPAANNAKGGDKFTNEVIIKGLSFSSDENDIGNFLEDKFGPVSRVNILKNEDGRSKGIAFVTFETEQGCNKAVEGTGVELQGRNLIIEKTKPKGERPAHLPVDEESKTIFVGNLPFTCDTESLKQFFASCGTVTDTRIAQVEGKSRGFGHVEFTDKSAVENALKKAGESFQGRPIKVDVAASRGKREGFNRGNGSFGNGGGAPRGDFQNERKGAIAEFKGQVKSL